MNAIQQPEGNFRNVYGILGKTKPLRRWDTGVIAYFHIANGFVIFHQGF
jgi:hypothetical protein